MTKRIYIQRLTILLMGMAVLCACTDGPRFARVLDRAEQMNREAEPMDSTLLDSLRLAVNHTDRHGSANDRMRAHYLQGCLYRDLGEAPQALQSYHDAIDCADTTRTDCDYRQLGRVYGQMGDIFSWQLLPHEMLHAYQMAQKSFYRAQDTLSAMMCYDAEADAYELMHDTTMVIHIHEHASMTYARLGKERYAAMTLGSIFDHLLVRGETDKARKYIHQYETESGLFDAHGDIESGREIYYYSKGLYYLAIGQTDSAEYQFRKEIARASDFNNLEAGYRGLFLTYKAKADKDSMAKYAELRAVMNDSSFLSIETANIQQLQSLYDYSRYEHIAQKKTQEANVVRQWLSAALYTIVIILLVLLHFWKKKQAEIRNIKSRYEDHLDQLEKEKHELAILHTIQSDEKNHLIDEKKATIQELQQRIAEYKQYLGIIRPDTVKEKLLSSAIYQTLCTYARERKALPTAADRKELQDMFDEEFPNFFQFIHQRYYNIRPEEYLICMLRRLDFSTYDIQYLVGISSANLSVIRKRLLKNIFEIDGGARDFDQEIQKIV